MKHFAPFITAVLALAMPLLAATPEQEKAFVDSYKKAFEAGDKKALAAFLYTEGAQPEQIEFFKMMQEIEPGSKVASIELVTPSAADAEKFNKPMTMPDGKSYVMGLKPTKQLVIVVEKKDGDSSSKSTRKSPVAEKNGKLVIPVPCSGEEVIAEKVVHDRPLALAVRDDAEASGVNSLSTRAGDGSSERDHRRSRSAAFRGYSFLRSEAL